MAKEIKQKIVLEGEKEYRQALKDAQRNLKTLRTELKAETAELGRNASEQQKAETRARSLKAQIAEQEKVVQTLRSALEQAKEQYGDNADAVARWEQQLNNARAGLADMRNELEGIGSGFESIEANAAQATVATKSVADSLDRLSEVGGAIADGIETAFSGMISTVKEAIAAVWGEITDLAARSNGLVDIAGYWNTEATTIQKWKGAAESASASLEDLNTVVTKINSLDSKKVAELTGVSKVNYKDEWQYAMDVMTAMSTLENRNDVGFELFGGKGATRAFDLLNDWDTILTHLSEFDAENGGFGLTGEQLGQMSTLNDQINNIYAKWNSLKDMATVNLFGQLSVDLVGNANAILDAFLEYFNATSDDERDAAIKKITDNITDMFERVKKAIEDGIALLDSLATELQASDNPTAKALGTVLEGLVKALQWITEDNMNNVVKALEILAVFWLTGKGAQMAAKIASVVSNIAVIKAYSGAGAATTAASGGGSSLLTAGAGFLGGVGGFGLGAAALTTAFLAYMDETNRQKEWGEYNANLATQELMGDDVPRMIDLLMKATEGLDENGNPEGMDAETSLNTRLFAENANEFLRLMPDAGIWEKISNFADLSDGLDEAEIADILANGFQYGIFGEDYVDLTKELYNLLNEMYRNGDTTGTPAAWWQTQGGNSGESAVMSMAVGNLKSLPGDVSKAVKNGMSNIKVNLDGHTVGYLVAPYVSEYIGRQMSVP